MGCRSGSHRDGQPRKGQVENLAFQMKADLPKGPRTRARIAGVEVLYRIDLIGENADRILTEVISRRKLGGSAGSYLKELVLKTIAENARIDKALEHSLTDWKLSRLSYVDRAILRLACCELLFFPQIPPKVSIDEAVELARFYGTEGAARLVNGVLDSVYKREVMV